MKAYLINIHLLVPRSRSSAKVKYKGYISQKMAVMGALVFHKHILFTDVSNFPVTEHDSFMPFPNKHWFFTCLQYKSFENTAGKGEIASDEQFLLFPQCFLSV